MDSYTFLRKVPLFADLPDSDLEKLCEQVYEIRLAQGELLFTEGSPGQNAYVIKEGQIEIFKGSNGQTIQLAVRAPGEVIGEIALLENTTRNASGRALTDSVLLVIGNEPMDLLLTGSPSAARTMLHTITTRLQTTELRLHQSEKMAQLGTLTAGIAHELNNPSAAIGRGAEQMKSTFHQLQQAGLALYGMGLSAAQLERLQNLEEQIRQRALTSPDIDPLARSDREAQVEDWLDRQNLTNSWELAAQLVNLGYDGPALDALVQHFSEQALPALLNWMAASFDTYRLLDEIGQGAGRLTEIVKALKSYVYLDQGPVQEVNVHEGLDNTLVILRHKLKQGIEVRREYDPAVPRIQAYGSELNQAWTNIIDNAIDSMDASEKGGQRTLVLHTRYEAPWVVVDIQDSGSGIPPEVQSKLFSPFFTTKPMGKGTGLGLNISYNIIHRHGGDIRVRSQPGETHFEIWLPADGKALQAKSRYARDDESLRRILETTRTIAVVGITDKVEKPNHRIPAYLQRQGYRILPVNPRLEKVLGEPAYATLRDVPGQVDVVLVFRAAEFVPEIVDEAIATGAKVVWMQEGITNEAAAEKAGQAGIEVVMDTCMRKTHQRILGEKT